MISNPWRGMLFAAFSFGGNSSWCRDKCAVQRRLLRREETKRQMTLCCLFSIRPSWWGSFIVSQFNISANSPGQNHVDDPLHPGSFRVQANLLPCLFQSGAARPRETHLKSVRWKLQKKKKKKHQMRCESGSSSYMISVSSQWELGGISSTLPMWRPMGRLSVWMQRQCCSTPRLLRLIAVGREVTKMQGCCLWKARRLK